MKKQLVFLVLLSLRAFTPATAQKMEWWQDAKFGLFLHWGLYSATAGDWKGHKTSRGEQFMMVEKIPWKEYAHIADTFNPVKFDANRWVRMARDAGMKYIVITTKHHDGFAMYNSPSSDYNVVKRTPWGKDPMKLLAEACRRYGLKLCFYYSLGRDWQDPDAQTRWGNTWGPRSNTWDYPDEKSKVFHTYFERKVVPQVKELLTQYGPIGVFWFDTPEETNPEESRELVDMIHRLQPDCIINSRVGNGLGDYEVYEQSIIKKPLLTPWESCVTISANWGYNRHDSAWKSANVLVRQLIDVVSKGGNYLLNLSPKGDGSFANESIGRLEAVGRWMAVNGEAIYGTRPWRTDVEQDSVYDKPATHLTAAEKDARDAVNDATSRATSPEIRFVQKGDVLYVFSCNPLGPVLDVKLLSSDSFPVIRRVTELGSGVKIRWKQEKDALHIELPPTIDKEVPVYVFKIAFSK